MATSFAEFPSSVLALPFLLARSSGDDLEWTVRTALSAAIAAERAVDAERRNTRARLAYLLCETGFQLLRRRVDMDQPLPILRRELADALGTSLTRVKRTLALLQLSGVAETDGCNVRITDWRRLARLGCYDPARLELRDEDESGDRWDKAEDLDLPGSHLTASGDPACFV